MGRGLAETRHLQAGGTDGSVVCPQCQHFLLCTGAPPSIPPTGKTPAPQRAYWEDSPESPSHKQPISPVAGATEPGDGVQGARLLAHQECRLSLSGLEWGLRGSCAEVKSKNALYCFAL